MNDLGKRIQQLRKQKELSQNELAKIVGVSYAQLSRYENKGTQPPAEVLNKFAEALGTSVDFLINGDSSQKAKATLRDAELLQQFKAVEELNDNDRNIIKTLIDAFLTKRQIQKLAV
jgi:transcriptional regulator with XRE-family HTH domain